MDVTIMGLGLHGGGLESARFFAERGARVCVTDLRDEKLLQPSIEALSGFPIRYVLGRHEIADFSKADLVIKNPAVRPSSPYLAAAKTIESDISIFLRYSASPLAAVTGSKGKSSTASAIFHGFAASGREALLGGNITVSPLSFLHRTAPDIPVVLELSSWQLADLRGKGVLKPKAAVITAIMPDHLNYYTSMEEYVSDKRVIYSGQGSDDFTICDLDSDWGRSFAGETRAKVLYYSEHRHELEGAWLEEGREDVAWEGAASGWSAFGGKESPILPSSLLVQGTHMKKNLLAASLALQTFGLTPESIHSAMGSFGGVEHRMELFAESGGVRWYNDSAATIPQASLASLQSFTEPVILIAGGADKNLDFEPVAEGFRRAKAIILLDGSATAKFVAALERVGIQYFGPFGDIGSAVAEADRLCSPGSVVLLSPGCASFGMFIHEFDRGEKFKKAVRSYLGLA